MKLNKLIVAVFALILIFPTFTTYADEQSTNFVKYENNLYYIGYDIPADSYILIQKDKSKPSFVGVYTNNSGPKASFKKKNKLSYGTEDDYIYPHFFERYKEFVTPDNTVTDNEGILLDSLYFVNNTCIDISYYGKYPYSYSRNDFLCLENCYAVSLNDIDKLNLNPEDNGFFPLLSNIKEMGKYNISPSGNATSGSLLCYHYDTTTKELTSLASNHNSSSNRKTKTETVSITIPEKTNIILKSCVNIYDRDNNLLYETKGDKISYSYDFKEKYNFSDVSPMLKVNIKVRFEDNYLDKENRDLFQSKPTLIKTEADKEYLKYTREILGIYNKRHFSHSGYTQGLMNKYFYNASSFKDLDFLLKHLLISNQFSIILKIDDAFYKNEAPNLYQLIYDQKNIV